MIELFISLIDPRGRCNRKGLMIVALILLCAETVAAVGLWLSETSLDQPAIVVAKGAMLWVAIAATAQRLHDVGKSAWHIVWATLALFIWSFAAALTATVSLGPDGVLPGTDGFWLIFGAVALPMLSGLLWLHFAPGQLHANRYGPVPAGLGFARPEARSRRTPEGAFPA